uniref:Uncharacterized protein n=1 Tax=Avena sativa TaxID=4498 RepID=A0ACD6AI43_AVESA
MALEKIAPIVPVTPFNVMADSYETFIENVRVALAGSKPDTVKGPTSKVERPVLAKETTPVTQPPRWIHVQLRGKNGETPKVAIRSDNAYIIGFTNSKGKWYQLSKTGTKVKLVDDNPLMAGFDGHYQTLIGGVDNLPTLNLNNFSMAEAAATLWNKTKLSGIDDVNGDIDDKETAMLGALSVKEAVATLAVAICEAARFIPVCGVISQGWTEKRVSVTTKEVSYIKDWGDLSSALLSWKKKNYKDESFFDEFKNIGISNGEQALAVVRLVKLVIRSNTMASSPTEEQLLAYSELPKLGRYMAEVFVVRIPAIAGGELPSGTISFHGGHYCSDFIYSWSPPEEHTSQQTCDSQVQFRFISPILLT